MPEIRQLPSSVVNKIAAGEVIERPASVVKELLENSVDAGAQRIDVTVEKGGIDLIRIADNGCGIAAAQLPLAVASHATSKIQDADDLFDVHTLGFRGEALASIAEVSQFLLRSRTTGETGGAELEVNGGRFGKPSPCGCPVGTIIEVRQLFFNTPVRRKFLRTTQTEMGHVSEAFTRIALAFPAVHFTLRHNDRTIYDLPPVDSWRERITTFFGAELGDSLIAIDACDGDSSDGDSGGGVRVSGFAADPNFSRGNNRMQYLFLNGRHIRDRSLQHALGEAYRGLLLTGRYPIAFLRLEIPSDAVDVNVHPTKLEVRFQDGGRIYSQLLGALRQKFLTTDLTAKVHSATPEAEHPAAGIDADRAERHRQQLSDWAKGAVADDPSGGATAAIDADRISPAAATAELSPLARQGDLRLQFDRLTGRVPDFQPFPEFGGSDRLRAPAPPADHEIAIASAAGGASERRRAAMAGLQVHNRYLITESERGVVIIDQHALHERILYEQLREKVLAGTLERQRLLVPETVSLTPAEAAAAIEAKDSFVQLGIEIEPFGGDTILVSSYPAMLANFNPAEVVRQMVEQIMAGGKPPSRRDLLDELLHMISCKAAIKAGDRLAPEEVTELLEQRHLFHDTHHCPHGRPTALVFSNEELDKRFKRT